MSKLWKKGLGKLGFMRPLLGRWVAEAITEIGPLRCKRTFEEMLGGAYIRLEALWGLGAGATHKERAGLSGKSHGPYEELAVFGIGDEGKVCFWSFTSDGKRSQGTGTNVTDIHPEAIGFETKMPAGLARMAYWPDDVDGYYWAVESRNAKGWRRFMTHHYHPE